MRVVSLVPSWTETLIAAGVDVVGRTRFCIHPKERVAQIPRVGGTKDWNWEQIEKLKPDLLLLDREENPKFMSEQNSIPWFATHVESIANMPGELDALAAKLGASGLSDLARRWERVLGAKPEPMLEVPGVLKWGLRPTGRPQEIAYLIWKDPWMAVSRDTFIGSVLDYLGFSLAQFESKYPRVELTQFGPEILLLFASEPYPFLKKPPAIERPHAIVDGECFSWFGLRTLEFLEGIALAKT